MSVFNPIERIGIHRSALIFLEEFGWIEREQPISDFGIDMHVEIVNNGIPTGQIFAIQVKSGKSYFKEETTKAYIFRGENKHLEYWLSQSLPVIILIYEPTFNSIFWQLVTSEKIIRTEKAWKIEIPKINLLDKAKEELKKIYYNPNHYVALQVSDISHNDARRIEAKILVESTHAKSLTTMRKMIPEIVEKFKNSDYHRNKLTENKYANKEAEVVLLFFYDSIQQVNKGLPFCRVIWNNENCQYKLNPFEPDEIIDKIKIKWESLYSSLSTFISNNEFSKGHYLSEASKLFNTINQLYMDIRTNFELYNQSLNLTSLKKSILAKKNEFDYLINNPLEDGFPPLECESLDDLIREASALIYNVWIVNSDKNRNEKNLISMIDYYLNLVQSKIKYYDYERKKIK
ncbi:DUF4365 domain-containing protein [uncultured Kordia sp.]|uniref:DUF4365 domain-containing protein n=1 Tax=uncultured Kordia sp. TaxID=507699 RepID=UPI002611CF9A|nr:DUF4365 domain-containing protein [uncultured Kordia sp.]